MVVDVVVVALVVVVVAVAVVVVSVVVVVVVVFVKVVVVDAVVVVDDSEVVVAVAVVVLAEVVVVVTEVCVVLVKVLVVVVPVVDVRVVVVFVAVVVVLVVVVFVVTVVVVVGPMHLQSTHPSADAKSGLKKGTPSSSIWHFGPVHLPPPCPHTQLPAFVCVHGDFGQQLRVEVSPAGLKPPLHPHSMPSTTLCGELHNWLVAPTTATQRSYLTANPAKHLHLPPAVHSWLRPHCLAPVAVHHSACDVGVFKHSPSSRAVALPGSRPTSLCKTLSPANL